VTGAVLDEAGFQEQAARHRRELHVHCYRMLASFDEAEDAVQEALLNAWRRREQFDGSGPLRAWLYRIATNVCLDMIRARGRRPQRASSPDVAWLQPYPDLLLDEIAAPEDGPDALAVSRETVELAFLTALQVLPARQRAALLLRDVLDMTAAETAELLETSVPAANSALQRARATMARHLPARRSGWTGRPSAEERELLARFVDAHERGDAVAALAAAAPDIRVTMPPYPYVFEGHERLTELLVRAFGPDREGEWRLLPTAANRMPAAASYLCRPGDTIFRPFKLDVLRVEGGRIREITTFGPDLFGALGLPAEL
jgi:RNA polymerase sigma-70 factor (TIGR02960 family)